MKQLPHSILTLLPLLALASCGPGSSYHASVQDARAGELPADWRSISEPSFEDLALSFGPRTLADETLVQLADGLADESTVCVRSAVLLARSRDPRARETLLQRLESRVLGSTREADAGDVVGAAALADWQLSAPQLDRLEPLVNGPSPHPDVEVRVEIAATLARCGRRSAIPFLLRVLREGTRSQDETVEWERKPQMAWAKSRTAEALSELAGVEIAYQEDGAFSEMEREADRLEQLLLGDD